MSIYFPYSEKQKRLTALHSPIEKLLYDPEQTDEYMFVFSSAQILFQYISKMKIHYNQFDNYSSLYLV